MEKNYLTWINTLYKWSDNSFTWNEVAEFVNVTSTIVNSGFELFSPRIKQEVRRVASPEQQEIFVKVISHINGKYRVQNKRKSPLTLKDVSVKDIHRAFDALFVKIKVHKS
jgi:hypothetical protein